MRSPRLPANEAKRLAALHCTGLLDTAPEERFDRVTRLARLSLRVPIALISLVAEDRQWFKSSQGLGETAQTPREVSFCAHAILGSKLFEVPDATEDARFADNPLVTGAPHIRFYAGVALHDTAGYRLGTLCVIDRQPRRLSADEKAALHDFAAIAEQEISRPVLESQVHYAALRHLNELAFREYAGRQQRYRDYLATGCQTLNMETGIVSRIRGEDYRVEAVRSPLRVIETGDVYPLGETYCAAVVREQNVVTYENVGHDPVVQMHPAYLSLSLESYIGAPIWVNRALYGTLNFSDRKPRRTPFSLAELQFVSLLANALGRAIEQQRDQESKHHVHQGLVQQKTLFESIFHALPDAVVLADAERRILRANPAAAQLFGYERDELKGRKTLMLYAHQDSYLQRGREQYHPGADPADSSIVEIEYRRKDGTTFVGETVGAVVHTPEHNVFGYLGVIRDISARKEVERIKEEFVSTVSHELRTPLTSLSGSLGLVYGGAAGTLPAKAAELVTVAYRNSERLIHLVNDILDMERLATGRIEFKMAPVSLRDMLLDAEEVNLGYAERYSVQLAVAMPVPEVAIHVDRDRMHQVLTNLISNAVKFTPVGSAVLIRACIREDNIRIEVCDEGPGIPDSLRPRLFERFAQADASDARQKGGTGLGLAISKAIVEEHHGRIGFEANQPRGTVFFVELPMEYPDSGIDLPVGSTGQVLICEDDPADAEHLQRVVAKTGLQAVVARSAQETGALFEANRYDVIIIDLWLPDGDGLSLIRNLRELDPEATFLVVSRAKRRLTEVEGIKLLDWLTKPVDTVRLRRALKTALTREGRNCILHVEDDPDVRTMIRTLCGDLGEIVPAGSLAEAHGRLASGLRPAAIILDLVLPDGSGRALFEHLRNGPDPAIPIVVFSGHDVEPDVLAQADAVIMKANAKEHSVRDTLAYLLNADDTP